MEAKLILVCALLCAVCFMLNFPGATSKKILAIFPSTKSPNHYRLGSAVTRRLAFIGHDITVVSPFFEKLLPDGVAYRDLHLTDFYDDEQLKVDKLKYDELETLNYYERLKYFTQENYNLTEKILKHKSLQKIIKNGEKFDAIIIAEYGLHALKALAPHFNAPLIIFAPEGPNFLVNDFSSNPNPLSYIPDITTHFSSHMNFFQRTINSFLYVFHKLYNHFYIIPKHQELVNKYIGKVDLNDALYNVSLVLSNSHPVVTQAVPTVPNFVEVGGFHVGPLTIVSMDVQKFLDEAPEGAILFHLGVNMKETNFPKEKLEAVVNTFGKIRQRVLWRFDNTKLNVSDNVMIRRWIPTSEILARETVKLLITAGDSKTVIEAVNHGVPVLVIPVFGEQRLNPQFVVDNGYGLTLNFQDLTEKSFKRSIKKILDSRKYTRNAEARSKIIKDRIETPMNETTYWIEYVANNTGAAHLRVAGSDLPWYQYLLLDVVGFVGLIFGVGLLVSCKILKTVKRKLCKCIKKDKKQTVKEGNKKQSGKKNKKE